MIINKLAKIFKSDEESIVIIGCFAALTGVIATAAVGTTVVAVKLIKN